MNTLQVMLTSDLYQFNIIKAPVALYGGEEVVANAKSRLLYPNISLGRDFNKSRSAFRLSFFTKFVVAFSQNTMYYVETI